VQTRFLHTESFRLAALHAAFLFLSMMILGALVYVMTDGAFQDQVLQFCDHDLAAIANGYSTEGIHEAKEIIGQRMASPGGLDFFLLEDAAGRRITGNLPQMEMRAGIIRLPNPNHVEGDEAEEHEILGRGAFLAQGLFVFVGRDLYFANTTKERIFHTLLWMIAATLILSVAGGMILSRNFLGRMDAIAKTCRAIIAGNFSDRVPTRGTRDEFDRLAGAINEMLDRIADLVVNLRQVSNDIAHDLRTPLTLLRHRLEQARVDARTPEDYSRAVDDAIAVSDRLLAIFSALLRIAQVESGMRRSAFAPIELRGLLQDLADIYRPVSEDSGHPFVVELDVPVTVQGDRELLLQLFANLIENAINHTPSGTQITLALSQTRYVASVSDTGPGVSPESMPDLFKRFFRLEGSRSTPGHGLGLALVAAIAELHSADVTVRDNSPGLRVEIAFRSGVQEPSRTSDNPT
jgi:signal transduction histidine kinase